MNENDVLRLNVSMKNLVLMHELNCIEKIPDDERGGLFWKSGAVGDDIKELAIRA